MGLCVLETVVLAATPVAVSFSLVQPLRMMFELYETKDYFELVKRIDGTRIHT